MKLVVLAAGYATWLYQLTLDRAKALLPVSRREMVVHVLERLAPIEEIDSVYLVTNAKFAEQFVAWAAAYQPPRTGLQPLVVDDGTTSDTDRLGAIGDLELVLRDQAVEDDVVVVASDNLFSESLEGFGRFACEKGAPVVGVYDVGDLSQMSKYNSIEVDAEGRVTFFEEKPERPRSTWMAIALYFYPRSVLPLVRHYLEEGNNPDQPGRLVEWLYGRTPVYTWPVAGVWYDIGSKETLEEANRAFVALKS